MFLRQGSRRPTTAILAVAMLAGGAGAAHAIVPKDPPPRVGTLIRINRGIGQLTVGLAPAGVRKILGIPTRTSHFTDTAGQRHVLRMDYRRDGLSLLFDGDATHPDTLAVIDVSSRRYHTTGGIHIRSSKRALLRAHHGVSCGSLSGGKPGEEVCAITGDGARTVFVTTTSHWIRSIQIGTD